MPEKDQEVQPEKKTTETTSVTEQPVMGAKTKRTVPALSTGWWVVLAVVAFFALLGAFAIGNAVMHMAVNRTTRVVTDVSGSRGMMFQDERGLRTGGMMGVRSDFDENTVSTTRVSGVVTAVDGSTITVAGNGTTRKVIVNDSTVYVGDDKPAAVNDTIMVVGTTSGDTLTANRVMLQRQ